MIHCPVCGRVPSDIFPGASFIACPCGAFHVYEDRAILWTPGPNSCAAIVYRNGPTSWRNGVWRRVSWEEASEVVREALCAGIMGS